MTEGAPAPPENVRVVMGSGREVPVECRYDGWIEGLHQWTAVVSVAVHPGELDGLSVRFDTLPARSSVALELVGGPA